MPASWRGDGHATRAGACRRGCLYRRAAISVTVQQRDSTQRHFVCHLLPAQGLGVPCAPGINDRRVTHKMCWVQSWKQIEGTGAQLASTLAGDVPPCQPRERSRINNYAGSLRFPASRTSAKPAIRTSRRQSVGRGRRRDGNMDALGRPARSLPPWCQTK